MKTVGEQMNPTHVPPGEDMEQLESVLQRIGDEPADTVRERERKAFDQIAGEFGERLVLFGAGFLGKNVLAGLRKAGVEPLAFADNRLGVERRKAEERKDGERRRGRDRRRKERVIGEMTAGGQAFDSLPTPAGDRDSSGREVMGVPVLSAAEAVERYGRSACFVVSIYQGSAVRRQLAEMGCGRVAHFAPLFWKYADIFIPQGGIDLPHRLREQFEAIRSGYAALADEASRREIREQLVWRCWLDFRALSPGREARETYFPADLVAPREDEVFVDCGGFDGDTVRSFSDHWGGRFRHAYSFEPDPANRSAMAGNLEKAGLSSRVTVMPYVVGNTNGPVRFECTSSAGSHVTGQAGSRNTGDSGGEIECRRLDDVEWRLAPSYIKMDIEGAEPEALAGAAELLRRERPVLAVCTYHRSEHLWGIPNLIRSIVPEYKLFLRRYAEECWEGVCYAIPAERLRRR